MTSPISLHTQDEHAKALLSFLPGGNIFNAKGINTSNLYKLFKGFSAELQRIEQLIYDITNDYDIRITNLLIDRWESAVGIPDDCFTNTVSLDQRRRQVLAKIAARGASTEQDFIDLAAILGFSITIEHLSEIDFNPPYDIPLTLEYGAPESRYVWIIIGNGVEVNVPPYDIPYSLENASASVIQCFFNKLKSAQTLILYKNN